MLETAAGAKGNPRPYGMPPFGQALSDGDLAAVATYVRNASGPSCANRLARERIRSRSASSHGTSKRARPRLVGWDR